MTTKSLEEITNFILSQFDQRISYLEEKSNSQKITLKAIKKDRKIAEIVTKPIAKFLPSEPLSIEKSITSDIKDYIRTKFPDHLGYLDEEELEDSPYVIKNMDDILNASPADITQMLSRSVVDIAPARQNSMDDMSRLIRANSRDESALYRSNSKEGRALFRGNSSYSKSPYYTRGNSVDWGDSVLGGVSCRDDQDHRVLLKKSTFAEREDYSYTKDQSQLNTDRLSKWETAPISRREISLTKSVLKGFKGSGHELKAR